MCKVLQRWPELNLFRRLGPKCTNLNKFRSMVGIWELDKSVKELMDLKLEDKQSIFKEILYWLLPTEVMINFNFGHWNKKKSFLLLNGVAQHKYIMIYKAIRKQFICLPILSFWSQFNNGCRRESNEIIFNERPQLNYWS